MHKQNGPPDRRWDIAYIRGLLEQCGHVQKEPVIKRTQEFISSVEQLTFTISPKIDILFRQLKKLVGQCGPLHGKEIAANVAMVMKTRKIGVEQEKIIDAFTIVAKHSGRQTQEGDDRETGDFSPYTIPLGEHQQVRSRVKGWYHMLDRCWMWAARTCHLAFVSILQVPT